MIKTVRITIGDQTVAFAPGETVLEVARRLGIPIPTLCHDPRLEPAGACRTCLVEIEGMRRLMPACATPAAPDMVVTTKNERVARHRKTLLSLYMTDHPADREASETGAPDRLLDMVERTGARTDWGSMEPRRAARPGDPNP